MTVRLAAWATVALLLGGCALDHGPYSPAGDRYSSWRLFGADVSFELPPGWMKANGIEHGLVATRDGFNLQTLRFRRLTLGTPLPHTRKVLSAGLSPEDLAEILIDDLRSDGSALGLQVLETRPATVAGQPGFRAVFAFKNSDGLRFKAATAGVLVDGYAWQLTYVAAARYYFERDLPLFEKTLASLAID
jgi:hypothetical protein